MPLDVQVTPLLLVALDPAVIFTAPEPAQVVTVVPAFAVGAAVIVIVFVEVEFEHGEFPLAVNVSVLLPAAISAALGVYVHVVNEVWLAKVPVPLDVQSTLELFMALEPAVMLTAPELEQVVIGVPATAVGAGTMVRVLFDVAFPQGELPIAVKVRVTLPTDISAALGV